MDLAKIVPLFSGSKGNSYYIGSGSEGVLIDAGKSCKQIETAMSVNEIDMRSIKAVFITHEHTDHCSALRVLANRYEYAVYSSEGTLRSMEQSNYVDRKCKTNVITDQITIGDMLIKRINISHDCAEGCCYSIILPDGRKAVIATDLGVMSEELRREICQSNLVVLESNHDVNMLRNGRYPWPLKQRILSDRGHLSNESCAAELAEFIKSGNNRIVLGHLSQENNTPDVARQTAICQLSQCGMKLDVDYTLNVAPADVRDTSIVF